MLPSNKPTATAHVFMKHVRHLIHDVQTRQLKTRPAWLTIFIFKMDARITVEEWFLINNYVYGYSNVRMMGHDTTDGKSYISVSIEEDMDPGVIE